MVEPQSSLALPLHKHMTAKGPVLKPRPSETSSRRKVRILKSLHCQASTQTKRTTSPIKGLPSTVHPQQAVPLQELFKSSRHSIDPPNLPRGSAAQRLHVFHVSVVKNAENIIKDLKSQPVRRSKSVKKNLQPRVVVSHRLRDTSPLLKQLYARSFDFL